MSNQTMRSLNRQNGKSAAWMVTAKLRIMAAVVLAGLLAGIAAPAAHAQGCVPLPPYGNEADRIGVNVVTDYGKRVGDYDTDQFKAGWFIDYRTSQYSGAQTGATSRATSSDASYAVDAGTAENTLLLPLMWLKPEPPEIRHDMGYAHVLRTTDLNGNWQRFVGEVVRDNPGMLWMIGNEPDRDLQDGMTPDAYAKVYHDAYAYIKLLDPSAQIAIAGVVQPTPLRLRYLDMILDEYQKQYGKMMPIDVWNIHAFILREASPADPPPDQDGAWGAGIPPGVTDYKDVQRIYNLEDHGDIEEFKQLIRDFRLWMMQRGYRNKPLLVSEYGILLAPDYPAGDGRVYDHAFVRDYMLASFDFMRKATNPSTGYPEDGNRLVQSWSWFGLNNYVYSYPDRQDGFNGNLVDHDNGTVQPLGHDFTAYTSALYKEYTDLAFRSASLSRTSLPAGEAGIELTVELSAYNRGNVDSPNSHVRFWLGQPESGGKLLAAHPVQQVLKRRCRNDANMAVTLPLPALAVGDYDFVIEIVGSLASADPIPENDRYAFTLKAR